MASVSEKNGTKYRIVAQPSISQDLLSSTSGLQIFPKGQL